MLLFTPYAKEKPAERTFFFRRVIVYRVNFLLPIIQIGKFVHITNLLFICLIQSVNLLGVIDGDRLRRAVPRDVVPQIFR